MTAVFRALAGALALCAASLIVADAHAQDHDEAYHEQREAFAADQFDAVMQSNARPARKSAPMANPDAGHGARRARPASRADLPTSGTSPVIISTAPTDAEVTLDHDAWAFVRERLRALDEEANKAVPPAVVLGAAEYTGEAIPGALALTMTLQVTLSGDGQWKNVPLIGEDTVLVKARVDGDEMTLSTRDGYHVWVTELVGEHTLTVDLLVPSRGPRGSLEYDFLVARTPVTRFSCSFPTRGLEPRLRRAVRADIRQTRSGTWLESALEPTSRIHLVGYRDLDEDGDRPARVYAETLSLLSVDDTTLEQFTVIRYSILQAGSRHFDVRLPAGFRVLTADGEGAFRYTVDAEEGGTSVLRGETAYPIRGQYEVSLRLARDLESGVDSFALSPPQPLETERAYGWLGVEVNGNLQLDELKRSGAAAVDPRQLPAEMLDSAVSPILRAWRYHADDASVSLSAARLPEQEPATGSIDRVRADSVVSTDGRVLTDLRITLRNRLRPGLRLRLPEGHVIRSSLLAGSPVQPSVGPDGSLELPLMRSAGGSNPEPFTLQVVIEGDIPSLGLGGKAGLELPAFSLPISALEWKVWMPASHDYSALRGSGPEQHQVGAARWSRGSGNIVAGPSSAPGGTSSRSSSGALPVRIDLPRTGHPLETRRYWLEQDVPPAASVWHVRSWVSLTAAWMSWLTLAAAILSLARPRSDGKARSLSQRITAGSILSSLALLTGWLAGGTSLVFALLAGGLLLAHHNKVHARVWAWWREADLKADAPDWSARSIFARLGLTLATGLTLLLVFSALTRLLRLLPHPL